MREDYSVDFYIRKINLALFQTGVGFLWFTPEIKGGFDNVDEAIDFNYHMKELARNEKDNFLFKEIVKDVPENETIPKEKLIPGGKKYKENVPFFLGPWIDDIVRSISDQIDYYPSRNKMIDGIKRTLPDKFVIFQCGTILEEADADNNLAYLTRGYKKTYRLSQDVASQIYQPFDNVRYYATAEGCGYFVLTDDKTPAFFRDLTKVNTDYYTMYMLALYQNYTLLRCSEIISKKLSSKRSDYKKYSKELEDNLDDITTELNIFLAKNVYSSVSHIQHQNEFFNYVSDRLLIKENIASVTAGIEALNNIENDLYEEEKEKKDKYLNDCLTIVSLFAIISAFNDINEFIQNHLYVFINIFVPLPETAVVYFFNFVLFILFIVIVYWLFKYKFYDIEKKRKSKKNTKT